MHSMLDFCMGLSVQASQARTRQRQAGMRRILSGSARARLALNGRFVPLSRVAA